MKILRTSPLSGKTHTMDLPVTQEDIDRCWGLSPNGTEHIQNVFPELSADQREFLKTGITPEEWEEEFGIFDEGDDVDAVAAALADAQRDAEYEDTVSGEYTGDEEPDMDWNPTAMDSSDTIYPREIKVGDLVEISTFGEWERVLDITRFDGEVIINTDADDYTFSEDDGAPKVSFAPSRTFSAFRKGGIPCPPVTEKNPVMQTRTGAIVKFRFRNKEPYNVCELNEDGTDWGRDMALVAGRGKELLEDAKATPRDMRGVPARAMSTFAAASKERSRDGVASCMLCSRPLKDNYSVTRGYGPECADKVSS